MPRLIKRLWIVSAALLVWGATSAFRATDYFGPSLRSQTLRCELADGSMGHPEPVLSVFEAGWYTSHLRAGREPSLYLASKAPTAHRRQTLRLTLLPSTDHPVIIRVDSLPSGRSRLTAKLLSGYGGYFPGGVDRKLVRLLSPDEAAKLSRAVADGELYDELPADCSLGLDGTEWVMESVGSDGYRYFDRWSPDWGAVHDVGTILIGFTGWTIGY